MYLATNILFLVTTKLKVPYVCDSDMYSVCIIYHIYSVIQLYVNPFAAH